MIGKYICEKCKKEFKQKGHYTTHVNKKNPCINEAKIKELVDKTIKEVTTKIFNTKPAIEITVNKSKTENVYENMNTKNKSVNKNIKFIDSFCGIGSFHYSFKQLGWECIMSCDIDNAAKQTYQENYGINPLGDITKIEPQNIASYDILCAGLPCQSFSQCGHHKGFNDERGTLFFNVMKFVKFHKPKIIIIENVQGLLAHDSGNTFQTIKSHIENAKYTVAHKVLKCSDYGIPQMRKRLFIIGIRNDLPMKNKINDILDFEEYKKNVTLSNFLNKNFEKDISYTIRCGGKNSPINDKHNWDGYIVNGKEYRLTVDDCIKLQGFDSSFKLKGTNKEQWKLLGNTIPTIFTEIIGKNINKFIHLI